jgi:hypothetical protein
MRGLSQIGPPDARKRALLLSGLPSQVTRAGLGERRAPWGEAVRERCAPLTPWGSRGRRVQSSLGAAPSAGSGWGRVGRPLVCPCGSPLLHRPHRQYHPSERWWGILAHQGHGTCLDSLDAVLPRARTMPWQGPPPVVALVTTP